MKTINLKTIKSAKNSIFVIAVACVATLALCMLAGCSGNSGGEVKDGGGTGSATKTVQTQNGKISIDVPNSYTEYVSNYDEKAEIYKDDNSKSENWFKVDTVKSDGSYSSLYLKGYTKGNPYTLDNVKTDISASTTLKNPRLTTLNGIQCYQCDLTTNGTDAYYYFGVVDNKPFSVQVVGTDFIKSDDCTSALNSLKVTG